jgi:hypothetical protein
MMDFLMSGAEAPIGATFSEKALVSHETFVASGCNPSDTFVFPKRHYEKKQVRKTGIVKNKRIWHERNTEIMR